MRKSASNAFELRCLLTLPISRQKVDCYVPWALYKLQQAPRPVDHVEPQMHLLPRGLRDKGGHLLHEIVLHTVGRRKHTSEAGHLCTRVQSHLRMRAAGSEQIIDGQARAHASQCYSLRI